MYTVLLRRWSYKPMDATIAVTLLAAIIYMPVYAAFLPKNIMETSWQECVGYGLFQGVLVAIIQMIFYTNAVHYLGASRLANDILLQLTTQSAGAYQSLDYFSKD